ncbi:MULTISPECIES: S4 domain-containing protein YaaA [Dellaglioa]|uniref:S4 domain protein YaaA n=2 Tax=Dellaglioa TaxID=2767880 RepID=A0A2C8EJA8_9LACO|nr:MULTISPECIES: S4 domain-containing protein YaaA [Dellaglioa]MCZ2491195.1 S4 domain-containing protein YaaA [Dellaglioa carnosa]MCZ2493567.1 S4 domain-containing protein YaaA [Dellaglioa carnosa]MCZ2494273.1 S4 domain-containing protein YaaA [Dellaglioa carnosa]MDK1716218.1 S4 domain-containing protein YaaA [Dellaglioa algida]MDK1717906.1 S4 domain-containing protein YaaA [Dellaglioa algida]
MKSDIYLETPYMMLQQVLKSETIINSGGEAKWFLRENEVLVNGELEDRRGRKLYPGDVIEVPGIAIITMHSMDEK